MNKEKKKVSNDTAQQDYVTNKLLCAFTIAFIMIIGVMYFSRMRHRVDTYVAAETGIRVLSIALLVATVIFAIIAIVNSVKGKVEKYKLLTAKHFAVVLGFATACFGAFALAFSESTVSLLYVVIPTVTVLFIVYHIYPRDFFAISTVTAFGAIGLWLCGNAIKGGMGAGKLWLIIGVVLAALAVLIVATIVIQANGGKVCRKCRCAFFDKDAKYYLLYATFALILALLVATWFLVGAATYYFLFILLAYFVVVGIYYTLKMI
ncbi:MAG: hypothetical protein IKU84_02735 [Clostridia bacterium]|nr:hypothetical protein [Clostridia bacterium]